MLKNKLKIIALFTVIILALIIPIVRAENETTDQAVTPQETPTENISAEATNDQANATTTISEENFKKSDVYLTGDDVTIDYIVDGNLFVVANNVTINSQIGGDAFICANTLTIGEQGYVFSNLFTFSKNVTINGVVYDLYAASQNTTINGYVYRDVRVGSDTVNLFGTIGRNAYVDCVNLNLTKEVPVEENSEQAVNAATSIINGNLVYSAKTEASIPEGMVVGETTFNPDSSFEDDNNIQDQILKLGTFVITIVVVWLLCLWLAPKFLENNISLLTTKKVLPVIGLGILAPIAILLLTILFFVLGITAPLAVLLLFALFTLFIISNAMFMITLNHVICSKLKIEKTMGILGSLIITSAILWLVGLIPVIGTILGIIIVILGTGITMSCLLFKEKTIKE